MANSIFRYFNTQARILVSSINKRLHPLSPENVEDEIKIAHQIYHNIGRATDKDRALITILNLIEDLPDPKKQIKWMYFVDREGWTSDNNTIAQAAADKTPHIIQRFPPEQQFETAKEIWELGTIWELRTSGDEEIQQQALDCAFNSVHAIQDLQEQREAAEWIKKRYQDNYERYDAMERLIRDIKIQQNSSNEPEV